MNTIFKPQNDDNNDAPLSEAEYKRLEELEDTIDGGLKTFIAVGNALLEIRDKRLYRSGHGGLAYCGGFEDYCRQRWGMSKTHANRLIQSAEVVEDVTPIGVIPQNEAQARPLAKLPTEERATAWKEAVETAPCGKVTAKHVEAVVARRVAPNPVDVEMDEGVITDDPAPAVAPAPRPALAKKPVEPLAIDREGHPIHDAAMAAIFAEREAFQSLARELSRLKASFAELANGPAGAVATTYVKQFNAAIDTAHDAVRFSLPHSLCPYCGGRKCQKCSQNGWMSETAWKSVPANERGQA